MRGYTKRVGKQVERICVSNPLASVTLSPCKQVLNSHFEESFQDWEQVYLRILIGKSSVTVGATRIFIEWRNLLTPSILVIANSHRHLDELGILDQKDVAVSYLQMAVLVNTYSKHATDVTSCSFSPTSKVLASSSGDKTVRLWNIEDGSEVSISPLLGHSYGVNSCRFSPFGTLLATASTDCNVHLWDVNTGSVIAVLQGHKSGVRVCRFSPNSRFLVTGSADETFCIWDVSSRKLVRCVERLESSVLTCCFTPDSLHVITGTSMGDLCVWDAQSGKLMKLYTEGHDMGVADCCFSPTFGSASKCHSVVSNL